MSTGDRSTSCDPRCPTAADYAPWPNRIQQGDTGWLMHFRHDIIYGKAMTNMDIGHLNRPTQQEIDQCANTWLLYRIMAGLVGPNLSANNPSVWKHTDTGYLCTQGFFCAQELHNFIGESYPMTYWSVCPLFGHSHLLVPLHWNEVVWSKFCIQLQTYLYWCIYIINMQYMI